MHERTTIRNATFMACLVGLAGLASCSSGGGGGMGPDVTVTPHYQPASVAPAPAETRHLSVTVQVIDSRQEKGPVRPDGREIIAQGDKGKVFVSEPVPKLIEKSLSAALQSAGFSLQPDAPVVVEATLVDLPLEATQFTNWGLPSERASTLDALGAVVPGPVRPTRAKASLNIVIRKHDARLGFSHVVSQTAENKSADRSVVEQTLDQAIDGAVAQAVAQAAPDIEIVTRTPVTAKEINGRDDEITHQEEVVQALTKSLAQKEATLADDRNAVEAMRRQIEEDRRRLEMQAVSTSQQIEHDRQALSSEKDRLADQRRAADAEAERLKGERASIDADRKAILAKIEGLKNKSNADQEAKQSLAELAQKQKTLDEKLATVETATARHDEQSKAMRARTAELENREHVLSAQAADLAAQTGQLAAAKADLESRRKSLLDRQSNLDEYEKKLNDQSAANQTLGAQLRQRQEDLAAQSTALAKWKQDLEARANVKPPAAVVEDRRPLIVITDPGLATKDTTLAQVPITGVAAADRELITLRGIVNGKAIDLMAPPDKGTRAVSYQPAPEAPRVTRGEAPVAMASKPFSFTADLHEGVNDISVEAVDQQNLRSVERLSIKYQKPEGKVFIVSIGINNYADRPLVPSLKYAVADATDVAAAFGSLEGGEKQVRTLLDDKADHQAVVEELFDRLPTEVRPADTVIIFFSGHGAPDLVASTSGNVEAFLLPSDADPTRLFTTAIRMSDVERILRRLRSERIVFMADTCFSGAAAEPGSRGISVPGRSLRAVTFRLTPRLPVGKGCAILTASKDSEAAQERSELGHGLFSYYVLKGLRGEADANHDHVVTVDELFNYVQTQVARATNGSQTPQISRDPAAGDIILSQVAGN
jgi:hypothetical protein